MIEFFKDSIMFWLWALAQVSAWSVSDTTDNNTGERNVVALQLSENFPIGSDDAALSLHCVNGSVQLWLRWPTAQIPEYATVSFDQGIASELHILRPPLTWHRLGPASSEIMVAPVNEGSFLIDAIEEGPVFRVKLHDQLIGKEPAIFLSENIHKAHRRLKYHCSSTVSDKVAD